MMRNKGLQEDDIQKLHTSAPQQLTDHELLLNTISAADLDRKHSGGWDKEHKQKRETTVCSMESMKDDSPLKARFFAVRKEIYNRYKENQQTEQ